MKFVAIFVIVCISACIGYPEKKDCPSEHEKSLPTTKVGDKHYYLELNSKANWFAANNFCNFHNMRLANIHNEHENTELGAHLEKLGLEEIYFWVSGNDLVEIGHWFWSSSGKRMIYCNWAPDEPNDLHEGLERCLDVAVQNETLFWNDDVCSFEYHFICE